MSQVPRNPAQPLQEIRPFHASEKNVAPTPAQVEGQLPAWLKGELLRTCPAVFELPQWRANHWFDGLGLLYAFSFEGDGKVSFRCRPLESEAARRAAAGEQPYATFDTRIQRSLWQRLLEPAAQATDNANVNIVRYGDEWVALTETPFPLVIDPKDLGVKGGFGFKDSYPARCIMTAHPQFDFKRQKVVNALLYIGALSYIAFYEHEGSSRKRQEIARLSFQKLPYVHSFGMTDEHIILVSHPHRMIPASLLWSNKGFIEAFSWQPEGATEIYVFDRRTKAWRRYETDPFFVFHVAHAYSDGDELVLDLAAHSSAEFISEYRTDQLKQQLPEIRSRLRRLRLNSKSGQVKSEELSAHRFEFPSVSYRRRQGQAQQWVWGAAPGTDASGMYGSPLVAVDVKSGQTKVYSEPDMVFGEPIFVGRPGGNAEDDGVILSVGSHMKSNRSVCLVLDAASFEVLARVQVNYALPLGFHGSFLSSAS